MAQKTKLARSRPMTAELSQVSPDDILANPDNPRLVFREDEMNKLLESIQEVGIQVPLSVYGEGKKYILLDGERRWRCARKLNMKAVPAIVVPKPSRLENILMMFNIHNVRQDWDLMPMAKKLGEVRKMLEGEGRDTAPKALAAVTGLSPATVNRALDLLSLPAKYQKMLLDEAEKPKAEQKIKPDLFIEVYRSLHAIERHVPTAMDSFSKKDYVEAMVDKYLAGTIDNVVAFRDVSRMARSEKAGISEAQSRPAIVKLVKDPDYSVKDAYAETVEAAYEARDLVSKMKALTEKVAAVRKRGRLSPEVREAMLPLKKEIDSALG